MSRFALTIAFATGLGATMIHAQEDLGRQEFMTACAACHGASAKGDGPLAELLETDMPDLTTLAAEKGRGEFPFEYVVWMVDGRKIIRGHGSEMPIWGDRYQSSATSQRGETAELVVRGRILSLVYYLESIQQ